MAERISFDADDITIVNDGTFENVIILGVKSGDGEKLIKQILNNQEIVKRVKLEHTKFAKWGFDGLQENGKSQLHLLNFCLHGKLPYGDDKE